MPTVNLSLNASEHGHFYRYDGQAVGGLYYLNTNVYYRTFEGQNGGTPTGWALGVARFTSPSSVIPAGKIITSATLYAYFTDKYDYPPSSNPHSVYVYKLAQGQWGAGAGSGGPTLSTQQSVQSLSTSHQWYSWNVLDAVSGWYSGGWNDGLGFRMFPPDSGDHGGSLSGSNAPYISVTYNSPPNPPGAFTSPLAGQTFRNSINIQWGAATDPDGQAVEYYMQYFNGTSWVALNGPGSLGRHLTNSYTWDVSNLPQHSNYQVRVYSTDLNGGESGWVTSGTFAINRQTQQMVL